MSDVSVNTALTEEAQQYYAIGYIARDVLPIVPVKHAREQFYQWGMDVREGAHLSSYIAEEYAMEFHVDDAERTDERVQSRLHRALDMIYLDWEIRASRLLRDPAKYGHHVTYLRPDEQWDHADCSPKQFLEHLRRATSYIRESTGGLTPNTIVLSPRGEKAFTQWVEQIFDDDEAARYVQPRKLRVLVGSTMSSVSMADAIDMQPLWGNDAILAYINPNPGLDALTFGSTFRARAPEVKQYRGDAKTTFYRVGIVQDEQLIAPDCGYLLQGVVH